MRGRSFEMELERKDGGFGGFQMGDLGFWEGILEESPRTREMGEAEKG